MPVCGMRIIKLKYSETSAIFAHNYRESTHLRSDIDRTRSSMNEVLTDCSKEQILSDVVRIEETRINKKLRKDAVLMCEAVITCPSDYIDSSSDFLQHTLEYYQNQFPESLFLSAVVHNDEAGKPHMHIDFVPISSGRLCCKELLNKEKLKALHRGLPDFMKAYGYELDVPRGDSPYNGITNYEDYKRTKEKERSALKEEVQDLKSELNRLKRAYNSQYDELEELINTKEKVEQSVRSSAHRSVHRSR